MSHMCGFCNCEPCECKQREPDYPTELEVYSRNGIKALQTLCGSRENAAGWRIDPKTGEKLDYHKEFGTKIALIHSEISEALEGKRKNKMDDHLPHRNAVEVEFGDAIIRILSLAEWGGLDVAGAIIEKLEYNDKRADHKLENRKKEGGKEF